MVVVGISMLARFDNYGANERYRESKRILARDKFDQLSTDIF